MAASASGVSSLAACVPPSLGPRRRSTPLAAPKQAGRRTASRRHVAQAGDGSDGRLASPGPSSLSTLGDDRRAAVQAQVKLITAAKRFAAELEDGEEDEEQLVAVAAFDSTKEALTPVQKRYAPKIAATLAQARGVHLA